MIGHLEGTILFSDGSELILQTSSGVGYQIYCYHLLLEGSEESLYITHVKRENAEELFAFKSLREKKIFELLLTVRGVGPKSAYSLLARIGGECIIEAIALESKSTLTKAPGIGPKAASQMILDLRDKIAKFKMYSDTTQTSKKREATDDFNHDKILDDAVVACKELGFREEDVLPLAEKIIAGNSISKAEQLVHLVLKEI